MTLNLTHTTRNGQDVDIDVDVPHGCCLPVGALDAAIQDAKDYAEVMGPAIGAELGYNLDGSPCDYDIEPAFVIGVGGLITTSADNDGF